MKITKSEFGMTKDNQPISLYTIENASGASVTLSDYGCRIIKIMVPNKEGKLTDVILGLMNADEYLADDASLVRWTGADKLLGYKNRTCAYRG